MKAIIMPALAIVVIGTLEGIALVKGIDGTLLSGALVIIAGIAGFKSKDIIGLFKK